MPGNQSRHTEPEIPLSNRRGIGLVSRPPAVDVGIDRLSLTFPVESFDQDAEHWDQVAVSKSGRHGQKVTYGRSIRAEDGRQVFVGVAVLDDVDDKSPSNPQGQKIVGKVEMNPSRLADPGSWELHGAEAVPAAVDFAHERALSLVQPEAEQDEWKVSRVDVARDFRGVSDPSRLLRALAPIHRPYAKRNLVHADPSKFGAQTLMVGSGAGVVRCYDKHAETKGKAPEGTLRYETEARSGWASQYGGIAKLSDLTAGSALALAWDRWNWSSLGAEVGGVAAIVQKVGTLTELSARQRAMFIGWALMEASGQGWGSKQTLANMRRLQRRLGLAIAPDADLHDSDGVVVHLDFATGREVVRVAA